MKSIKVSLKDQSYEIKVQMGLHTQMSEILSTYNKGQSWVLFSQQPIFDLYGSDLVKSLRESGFKIHQIILENSEVAFRIQLIRDLLQPVAVSAQQAQQLQNQFDGDRLAAFDFYPGIKAFLRDARQLFTLVVITNGPEFSQVPKVEAVNLAAHVDHIIIGGQEPEQKPARSIFDKALKLANCDASEAIHVGDSLAADIAGAHHSRITSVWIQHQQPLDAELGINPNHTIMHPSELPSLIERLHKL